MIVPTSKGKTAKAEIRFEEFPCRLCAAEAGEDLGSWEGIIEVFFNHAVRRVSVLFDPRNVDIPHILSRLEHLGKPRVVSVITGIESKGCYLRRE